MWSQNRDDCSPDRLLLQVATPTVRLTVDLPQSTHKKLSILCANTGMKKIEVVRMLLNDALKDTNT
jgi:hypothetical protein